jgi:hypothetical protein
MAFLLAVMTGTLALERSKARLLDEREKFNLSKIRKSSK